MRELRRGCTASNCFGLELSLLLRAQVTIWRFDFEQKAELSTEADAFDFFKFLIRSLRRDCAVVTFLGAFLGLAFLRWARVFFARFDVKLEGPLMTDEFNFFEYLCFCFLANLLGTNLVEYSLGLWKLSFPNNRQPKFKKFPTMFINVLLKTREEAENELRLVVRDDENGKQTDNVRKRRAHTCRMPQQG